DPLPAVERQRLRVAGCAARVQPGMSEPDVPHRADALPVRPAECERPRHAREQFVVDRCAVRVQHGDDAAHVSIRCLSRSWPMNSARSARSCGGSTSYSWSSASYAFWIELALVRTV